MYVNAFFYIKTGWRSLSYILIFCKNIEVFVEKKEIMWYKINRIIRFNGGNLWRTEI